MTAVSKTAFGIACLCVLGLTAFLGSGASSAGAADACANEAIRVQQGAGALPGCRAYEMVSPLDKNGADIEIDRAQRAAADGSRMAYTNFANFAGGLSSGFVQQYVATRTAGGWSTISVNPPQDPYPNPPGPPQETTGAAGISPDISTTVSKSWVLDGYPDAASMRNLFRFDVATAMVELVSTASSPGTVPPDPLNGAGFAGATPDFSRITFVSSQPLTPDSPPNPEQNLTPYLYAWTDGEVELINYLPPASGGEPTTPLVQGKIYLGTGGSEPYKFATGTNPISEDGTRIYWGNDPLSASSDPTSHLYLREDPDLGGPQPAVSLQVDSSEQSTPTPGDNDRSRFAGASADGSVVLFSSNAKLTDDSTAQVLRPDLYRWERNAPAGERLTDLTPQDPDGASVATGLIDEEVEIRRNPVLGINRDGTRAFFVATGNLAPGATDGERNIYFWEDGEPLRFVATLTPADSNVYTIELQAKENDARVTPDADRLLFRSRASLTTYETNGTPQVYMYDVSDDAMTCVSCNPRQVESSRPAFLKRPQEVASFVEKPIRPNWLPRNISSDGRRVFFDSSEALLSSDTNGRIDTYLWEEGELNLISSGQSSRDSAFMDASESGDDVFFATRQQLVTADTDHLVDVYDARVGGGFTPAVGPPECEGDSCQPPPRVPDDATPASAGYVGLADPEPDSQAARKKCKKGQRRKNGRCVRKEHRAKKRAGTKRGGSK